MTRHVNCLDGVGAVALGNDEQFTLRVLPRHISSLPTDELYLFKVAQELIFNDYRGVDRRAVHAAVESRSVSSHGSFATLRTAVLLRHNATVAGGNVPVGCVCVAGLRARGLQRLLVSLPSAKKTMLLPASAFRSPSSSSLYPSRERKHRERPVQRVADV